MGDNGRFQNEGSSPEKKFAYHVHVILNYMSYLQKIKTAASIHALPAQSKEFHHLLRRKCASLCELAGLGLLNNQPELHLLHL